MKRIGIIYLLSCILLLGCGDQKLTPLEYVQWVENPVNGLKVKKEIGAYQFVLQYQPLVYTILNELQQEEIEEKVLQQKINVKEGLQYVTLKISAQHKSIFGGKNLTDSVRHYLNYEIKRDFYLLEESDTLRCQLFHYENTNGMTPHDAFVLGFEPSEHKMKDKKFLFKGNIIGLDKVELDIKNAALNRIPKVKTI